MGVRLFRHEGISSVHHFANPPATPYTFRFDSQNADNERNLTFNALVAAAIGREFRLYSNSLMCFRHDRGPGDPEATPTGAEPGSSTSTSSKTAGSNSASSTSTSSTSTSNAVPGARTNTGTIAGGKLNLLLVFQEPS